MLLLSESELLYVNSESDDGVIGIGIGEDGRWGVIVIEYISISVLSVLLVTDDVIYIINPAMSPNIINPEKKIIFL